MESYHTADQFPPGLGLSWQMKNLSRKIFGLVLQCRTGHAFMGEYAARHRPGEDVSCPCGAGLQSRDHILQLCPRYEDSRHILQAVSSNIDTFRILGTKKGIKALSQFISKSGAFTKSGEEVLEVEEVVGGWKFFFSFISCYFLLFHSFLSLMTQDRFFLPLSFSKTDLPKNQVLTMPKTSPFPSLSDFHLFSCLLWFVPSWLFYLGVPDRVLAYSCN